MACVLGEQTPSSGEDGLVVPAYLSSNIAFEFIEAAIIHFGQMEATDMRGLSREVRHERRVPVIRPREADLSHELIAQQTGLSRTSVFNICARHEAGGASALRDRVGGRPLGDGRLLSAEQEAEVRRLIADRTPDQLKMPYALWTRAAVAQLIEQRFGVVLAVRTMGLYLKRWGFTPQKPMKKACEQSPAAVKRWLQQDYPAIAARQG